MICAQVDAYDWGVFRADRTLGMLLDALRRRGRLDGHHRIVVTSDHGEFLAERGLVGHGGFLFEANNRVPVVYYDSAERAGELEEPHGLEEPEAPWALHEPRDQSVSCRPILGGHS